MKHLYPNIIENVMILYSCNDVEIQNRAFLLSLVKYVFFDVLSKE